MVSVRGLEEAITCSVTGKINWFQNLSKEILKTGHVPNHVAFIADGNRRYAEKIGIDHFNGKCQGFDKLVDILLWCIHFGIPYISFYTLSTENFKRSKEETDDIMEVVKRKLKHLSDDRGLISQRNICVRFVGNLSMIPVDVRNVISESMKKSERNTTASFNMIYCYSSRDEITKVVQDIAAGVQQGEILPEDIYLNLFSNCLYTHELPEPDLLIRTSEARFSDFLMWQSASTCLYFVDILWPEFTFWNLATAIFYYQRCYNDLQQIKNYDMICDKFSSGRAKQYISKRHKITQNEKFKIQ